METIKFNTKEDFEKYVATQARKILKEETVKNLGIPTDLTMNKNDGAKNSTGAKVEIKNGTFKTKTGAPVNTPKEFDTKGAKANLAL